MRVIQNIKIHFGGNILSCLVLKCFNLLFLCSNRLCLSRYSLSRLTSTFILFYSFHAWVTFTTLVSSYIKYSFNFPLAHIMMELLSFFYRIHILHVYYILIATAPRAKLVSGCNSEAYAFSEHQGKYTLSYEI